MVIEGKYQEGFSIASIAFYKEAGAFLDPLLIQDMVKDNTLICIYPSIYSIYLSTKFSLTLVEEVKFQAKVSIPIIGLGF